MSEVKNIPTTKNGMRTNVSSLNNCVDMFFNVGAMRGKSKDRLITMFSKAYNEDPLTATKLLFWARDAREGAGERQIFRDILSYLAVNQTETLRNNINLIPEFGRWDDLFVLIDTELKGEVVDLIITGLSDGNGLLAKWMPRKGQVFNDVRKALKVSPKELRKTVVELSNTVEQKMCSGEWSQIEYSKVPSLAMSRYLTSFYKNDEERLIQYRESLKKGETKINAGAVYPYDIVKSLLRSDADKSILSSQWEALPNWLSESEDEMILPVVDTSGSMCCSVGGNPNLECIDVALSLGLYISERNVGPFKDAFMTFSEQPKLMKVQGSLSERLEQMNTDDWGMSTNLQAVFELVLEQAVKHGLPQGKMPNKIIILSDMDFNRAKEHNGGRTWGRNDIESFDWNPTAQELIKGLYEKAGYNVPDIIYWNLSSNGGGNSPVSFDESGTALLSGFSPSIVKSVLGADELSPKSIMMKTVDSDRYSTVRV